MLMKEFRVTLPLTIKEYQVGQLYSVAEASKRETGGGEGVEILVNEPFDNVPLLGGKINKGQYTKKIYHFQSQFPSLIKMIVPNESLEVHEEAWNAYPYCKTVITNPGYMKENFFVIIESLHFEDAGQQENVHELTDDQLKQREVVRIDIANDPISANDYKENEDPTKFKSEKTGRGPLLGNWIEKYAAEGPIMTAYKLVQGQFLWRGLQTRVENFMFNTHKRLSIKFNRQVFCWMDSWYDLTMEDIRRIEDETKGQLDTQRLEKVSGQVEEQT
ncbi:hypothetical protein WDU94_001247 [Cyamophila willieti]